MVQRNPAPAQSAASTRIIGIALLLGATLFAAVAVAMPFLVPSEPGDSELLDTLSLVNLVLFLSLLPGAFFLPPRLAANSPTPAFTRRVLRWALLEGGALFGIVVVLLAGLEGLLPGKGIYYLNLVPYFAFAFFVISDLGQSSERST